jgi:hypothetical protein
LPLLSILLVLPGVSSLLSASFSSMVTATATFNSLQPNHFQLSRNHLIDNSLAVDSPPKVHSPTRSLNGQRAIDPVDKATSMVLLSDQIRRTASNPDLVGSHTGLKTFPGRLASERLTSSASSLLKGPADQTYNSQTSKRMYASNSVKVRDIQVTSSCFEKVRLLGKGDIGRVFLVRRKGGDKLYAMKGELSQPDLLCMMIMMLTLQLFSLVENRNDQTQQDQEGITGTGNPILVSPSVYSPVIPQLSER